MLSLAALANWESAVLASIGGAAGTADERDAQITRSGMYAEYPAIFNAYVAMLEISDEPAAALEALKRVVFLAWFSFTAPSIESGLSELPESSVRRVMRQLDAAIAAGRVDEELRDMLATYRLKFGYVFDHFGPVRSLDAFVAGASRTAANVSPTTLAERGQMGAYWRRSRATGG